jgi:hypothetical protein
MLSKLIKEGAMKEDIIGRSTARKTNVAHRRWVTASIHQFLICRNFKVHQSPNQQ